MSDMIDWVDRVEVNLQKQASQKNPYSTKCYVWWIHLSSAKINKKVELFVKRKNEKNKEWELKRENEFKKKEIELIIESQSIKKEGEQEKGEKKSMKKKMLERRDKKESKK